MRYISWIWFLYVILGFVLGGGSVYLLLQLKAKEIQLVWYEWLLGVLSLITVILLGQTFIASFQEGEPQAAWLSLAFMGIPTIIMVVAAARSIKTRALKAS